MRVEGGIVVHLVNGGGNDKDPNLGLFREIVVI